MKITDFLRPDEVLPDLRAQDKAGALREMAVRLCEARPELAPDEVVRTLEERELLASTALGEGVAIPHGKMAGITSLAACLARSRPGVNFASMDGQPTHLLFLLIAPEHSTGDHLKALARISRLFKDPAFRSRLMKAKDAAEIYRSVADGDAKF